MDRARRWTIIVLVILTGVVAGFARLDGENAGPPSPPQVTPEQDDEVDPARADRYLQAFIDLLNEIGASAGGQAPALPPPEQFPPLPEELLPAGG